MARPKLLLADDSVTIRKVVELTFADEGIDVTTAADAETAMQKFVEIQPDIVLVDIGLPGTAGYQICEMIKQDDATKHIPVLLLVGSFEPFDQDEAERVCSDGFLTKPFHSIRDLVARVWDLLGRESTTDAPIEVQAAEPAPDTADIENLYDSSFANTAEIEEFDTVDDLLGDASMDDELIEASTPANNGTSSGSDSESASDAKQFDWSSESLISDTEVSSGSTNSGEYDEFGDMSQHETIVDDVSQHETIVDDVSQHETIVDDPSQGGPMISDESQYNSVADEPISDALPLSASVAAAREEQWDRESEAQLIDDVYPEVDQATENGIDNSSVATSSVEENTYEAPVVDLDDVENPIYEAGSPFDKPVESSTVEREVPVDSGAAREPSPELIALVAQRVIDRLSDQVVRDIAKEAVPRIAEKLIREALEQEKKG